jgi:hypothetical protein
VAGFALVSGAAAFAFALSDQKQSARAELQFHSPALDNFGSLGLGEPGRVQLTPEVLRAAADSAGVPVQTIRSATSVDRDPRSGGWFVSATSDTTDGAQEIADSVAAELRGSYQGVLSRRAVLGLRYIDFLLHRARLREMGDMTRASLQDDERTLTAFARRIDRGGSPKLFRANVQPSSASRTALARAAIAALAGLFLSLLVIALYDRAGASERGVFAGLGRRSSDS